MNTKQIRFEIKTMAQLSFAAAVVIMSAVAQAGVSQETVGFMAQYCEALKGIKPGVVASLKEKYCSSGIQLPETNREAAQFMLDLSHETGTVRFGNWSNLRKSEREVLEDVEWDALNLSNLFTTRSVDEQI